MNEQEAISRMIAPGTRRLGKYREGVIQIWLTRACDKACFGCTQGSNLGGKPGMITLAQFESACKSLRGYFGVVGIFGGNPAVHPQFDDICNILCNYFPKEQRGLWCNNPLGHGKVMASTFDPMVSNLNVHLDERAFNEFRRDWPESRPFGLTQDSRHSPPFVAMQDIIPNEYERWELISNCDINKHWSAMICVFRGELRAYFCEVAGAQAMLHQDDSTWPDLGILISELGHGDSETWWRKPMEYFHEQVKYHCHRCGVPLRGYGELAQSTTGSEQTSEIHKDIYKPKKPNRRIELVMSRQQLGPTLAKMTDYLGNAKR